MSESIHDTRDESIAVPFNDGWLIEAPAQPGSPWYWNGHEQWTQTAADAVNFSTQGSAERVIVTTEMARVEFVSDPSDSDICAKCGRRGRNHLADHPIMRMAPPAKSWRAG